MFDIIIIGAGAAGMTAALYALRSGKSVLVLESETIGGQIAQSPRVENFPSIKEISGMDLSSNLFDQIQELGANFELENVLSVAKENGIFNVTTDCATHQAKSVILAVGVKHKHLNLPNESELIGNGISYCAVCDGAFYKGEEVVLIGDANTALQYSILLSNYCKKVHVCTLFDKFFGDLALVNTLKKRDNVKITHNIALTEYKFALNDKNKKHLTGLVFTEMPGKTKTLTITTPAVFIAIGQVPSNKTFDNLVTLDRDGYIICDDNLATATPGLFTAGDCRAKKVRQLTTAVSDGAVSALSACSYIDSLN